jgi:hypothetical protein
MKLFDIRVGQCMTGICVDLDAVQLDDIKEWFARDFMQSVRPKKEAPVDIDTAEIRKVLHNLEVRDYNRNTVTVRAMCDEIDKLRFQCDDLAHKSKAVTLLNETLTSEIARLREKAGEKPVCKACGCARDSLHDVLVASTHRGNSNFIGICGKCIDNVLDQLRKK